MAPALLCTVMAEKKAIDEESRKHTLKHIQILRDQFSFERAADYLQQWVTGVLPPSPLLDVSV